MSQVNPKNLLYTKDHEWARIEGESAIIGITDFAQKSLGDIVFVELPEKGKSVKAGETFGVVESIKSVSDLFCPLSGEVTEVNSGLVDSPEKINAAPYESWMIKIKLSNSKEMDTLISFEDYKNLCENL
jgi:glycine cleavage system H protein